MAKSKHDEAEPETPPGLEAFCKLLALARTGEMPEVRQAVEAAGFVQGAGRFVVGHPRDVADFFGTRPPQVKAWRDVQGYPYPKAAQAEFDLAEIGRWLWRRWTQTQKVIARAGHGDREPADQLRLMRVDQARLDYEAKAGRLLDLDATKAAIARLGATLSDQLQALARRLSPALAGREAAEVERLLSAEVNRYLSEFTAEAAHLGNGKTAAPATPTKPET